MTDTLMTIIGIFVAVVLMFVLPLTIMANKNDEIAQTVVQVAVSDFVETVTNQGRITEFDYNKLVQKISATGNAYDIQIEAQIIDDNPRRATSTGDSSQTGEYKYYSVYTNTIMNKVQNDGFYELKKDDYVIVNVKSTNITLGTQFKNLFYRLTGKDTYTIGTSASGIVVNSDTNVERAATTVPNKPVLTERNYEVKISKKIQEAQVISGDLDIVVVLDCENTTMPYHNENSTSQSFIRNIITAVGNKGRLSFILTCKPTTVYTDLSNISWIFNAVTNENKANYISAMNTALKTVKDKTGNRCIVFLSWNADKESRLSEAVNIIASNSSNYDLFCTTPCCSNKPQGSLWQSRIPADKWGGNLIGNDIKERFNSLLNKTILVDAIVEDRVINITTTDFKLKLDKYNSEYNVNIIIDGQSYTVGTTMPSYVIYFDTDSNSYVLDMKLVKEILNISDADWESADIQIEYVRE